jgi:beta-hydroxylase
MIPHLPGVTAAVTLSLAAKLSMLGVFAASLLYLHFRGRERLGWRRQLTDHSAFLAPYNVLIDLASGLPRRPVLDVADLPELARLRESWVAIREEALRLYEAGHLRASERHEDLGFESFFRRGWKRFYLAWYGTPLPSARALCPKTVELVESIPSIHGALFTLIEPHREVSPHRDPFAGALRYHLGLITPNHDDCCIFVDGERHAWRDGQDLLFDETYVHHFRNRTDQPRIIFFADVERPIRNRGVRALNRFVIRHVVGITASRNLDGEPLGFANRVYRWVYRARQPVKRAQKRLKRSHRPVYYALRWGALAMVLYLLVFAGSGPPR